MRSRKNKRRRMCQHCRVRYAAPGKKICHGCFAPCGLWALMKLTGRCGLGRSSGNAGTERLRTRRPPGLKFLQTDLT